MSSLILQSLFLPQNSCMQLKIHSVLNSGKLSNVLVDFAALVSLLINGVFSQGFS